MIIKGYWKFVQLLNDSVENRLEIIYCRQMKKMTQSSQKSVFPRNIPWKLTIKAINATRTGRSEQRFFDALEDNRGQWNAEVSNYTTLSLSQSWQNIQSFDTSQRHAIGCLCLAKRKLELGDNWVYFMYGSRDSRSDANCVEKNYFLMIYSQQFPWKLSEWHRNAIGIRN